METALRLLMRDGAVQVIFRPRLGPAQYAELAQVIDHPATKEELRRMIREMGAKWGSQVEFEDCV